MGSGSTEGAVLGGGAGGVYVMEIGFEKWALVGSELEEGSSCGSWE